MSKIFNTTFIETPSIWQISLDLDTKWYFPVVCSICYKYGMVLSSFEFANADSELIKDRSDFDQHNDAVCFSMSTSTLKPAHC